MANFFLVLLFLGLAALVGKKVGWIHRYRIPPSLTGGLSLLLLFTFLPTYKTTDFFVHLKSLPSEFIALVFACFFLQKHDKAHSKRRSMRDVLAQTSMVWVAVMGQVLIGLVTTVFIFKPFFNEPLAFASVLETGFSGGHGTAVAMGPILAQNGIAAGLEYGLFSATIGLICGIVGGVWLIHHERRRMVKSESAMPESEGVSVDLHRLLVAALLIAAAYWLGIFFKGVVEHEILPRTFAAETLKGFTLPLFAYTLLGGAAVRLLCRLAGLDHLIDNAVILLLADFFLEILIFAGIAIVDVHLLGQGLVPLLSVFALGFIWNFFCHFYFRPRILTMPYSFELGLINFGMLNGTSATGLMLLKMVDPHFKTPAVRVFAEGSMLTQPFIAGGFITLLTPFIVTALPPWISIALYASLLVVWLIVGLSLGKRR